MSGTNSAKHLLVIILAALSLSKMYSLLVTRAAVRLSTTKRFLTTNVYIVGKKNGAEAFVAAGCAEYEKRVDLHVTFQLQMLRSIRYNFLLAATTNDDSNHPLPEK